MADPRLEPVNRTAPAPAPAMSLDDPDYHCANCAFLGDPTKPETGFWACQNLCLRD
jgi:hypothetical protein